MVSGEPSNSLPAAKHTATITGGGRFNWGVPSCSPSGLQCPTFRQHEITALTTTSQEEQVPGEQAGGAPEGPCIQHKGHVPHGVAWCGQCLKSQAAHAQLLPVPNGAVPAGRGGARSQIPKIPSTPKTAPTGIIACQGAGTGGGRPK